MGDIDRGKAAARLLDDELLQEMFSVVEQTQIRLWRTAETVELRETAWYTLKALEAVKLALRRVVDDGLVAEKRQRS